MASDTRIVNAQQFFPTEVWEKLAPIERKRYENLYKSYLVLKDIGLDTKAPSFTHSAPPPSTGKKRKSRRRHSTSLDSDDGDSDDDDDDDDWTPDCEARLPVKRTAKSRFVVPHKTRDVPGSVVGVLAGMQPVCVPGQVSGTTTPFTDTPTTSTGHPLIKVGQNGQDQPAVKMTQYGQRQTAVKVAQYRQRQLAVKLGQYGQGQMKTTYAGTINRTAPLSANQEDVINFWRTARLHQDRKYTVKIVPTGLCRSETPGVDSSARQAGEVPGHGQMAVGGVQSNNNSDKVTQSMTVNDGMSTDREITHKQVTDGITSDRETHNQLGDGALQSHSDSDMVAQSMKVTDGLSKDRETGHKQSAVGAVQSHSGSDEVTQGKTMADGMSTDRDSAPEHVTDGVSNKQDTAHKQAMQTENINDDTTTQSQQLKDATNIHRQNAHEPVVKAENTGNKTVQNLLVTDCVSNDGETAHSQSVQNTDTSKLFVAHYKSCDNNKATQCLPLALSTNNARETAQCQGAKDDSTINLVDAKDKNTCTGNSVGAPYKSDETVAESLPVSASTSNLKEIANNHGARNEDTCNSVGAQYKSDIKTQSPTADSASNLREIDHQDIKDEKDKQYVPLAQQRNNIDGPQYKKESIDKQARCVSVSEINADPETTADCQGLKDEKEVQCQPLTEKRNNLEADHYKNEVNGKTTQCLPLPVTEDISNPDEIPLDQGLKSEKAMQCTHGAGNTVNLGVQHKDQTNFEVTQSLITGEDKSTDSLEATGHCGVQSEAVQCLPPSKTICNVESKSGHDKLPQCTDEDNCVSEVSVECLPTSDAENSCNSRGAVKHMSQYNKSPQSPPTSVDGNNSKKAVECICIDDYTETQSLSVTKNSESAIPKETEDKLTQCPVVSADCIPPARDSAPGSCELHPMISNAQEPVIDKLTMDVCQQSSLPEIQRSWLGEILNTHAQDKPKADITSPPCTFSAASQKNQVLDVTLPVGISVESGQERNSLGSGVAKIEGCDDVLKNCTRRAVVGIDTDDRMQRVDERMQGLEERMQTVEERIHGVEENCFENSDMNINLDQMQEVEENCNQNSGINFDSLDNAPDETESSSQNSVIIIDPDHRMQEAEEHCTGSPNSVMNVDDKTQKGKENSGQNSVQQSSNPHLDNSDYLSDSCSSQDILLDRQQIPPKQRSNTASEDSELSPRICMLKKRLKMDMNFPIDIEASTSQRQLRSRGMAVTSEVWSDSTEDEKEASESNYNEKPWALAETPDSEIRPGIMVPLRRYPKRKHVNKQYMQEKIPREDDFIYCEDCCQEWEGECARHPLTLILDKPVVRDGSVSDRARLTTPWPLSICPSKVPGAGLGVWTNADLPPRLLFGPYQGRIITGPLEGKESGYGWKLRGMGEGRCCVDAVDASVSNWMRYVNCPRNDAEMNLGAFQYKGQIYYRTVKDINRGAELMVWYGDDYGQDLGLSRASSKWYPTTTTAHGTVNKQPQSSQPPTTTLTQVSAEPHPVRVDSVKGNVKEGCHSEPVSEPMAVIQKEVHISTKISSDFSGACDEKISESHSVGECESLDCGECFKRVDHLKEHRLMHTGEKPHECPECGKRFNQLGDMKTHRLIHTGEKPHECPECGKRFNQLGDMKRHILIHTGEKPHECPEYGKRFNWLGHMKTHRLIHTGEKPYECPECGKRFNQLGNMKKHRLIHTGEKPHECPECGKRFIQLGSMKTHRLIHTGEKPHECPECGKRFKWLDNMKIHRLIHTGEKPHECPECGKRFKWLDSMKKHRLIHTGEKPYECPECGKRFNQLGSMKRHRLIHTGEKPHECPECGKRFTEHGSMKKHRLIHTGEKPHECPECGKRFNQLGNMKRHRLIHTGEKPHECPECGKRFTELITMKKHRSVHKGSE